MHLRIFRSITSIMIITLLALVYVHQQVELVKLSYAIDYKERKLEHMLDQKDALGYNIKELENPSRLEKILLSKNIEITFPKRGNVVNFSGTPIKVKTEESLRHIGVEKKDGLFRIFEFFGLRAEAQARER